MNVLLCIMNLAKKMAPLTENPFNDIVIIYDKDLHRGLWKIGLVSKVFSGIDGKVRHVNVK